MGVMRGATRAFVKGDRVLTGKQKHETLNMKITVMKLETQNTHHLLHPLYIHHSLLLKLSLLLLLLLLTYLLRALSPQANYTDRAITACRRS
jgi:hypothetical protein